MLRVCMILIGVAAIAAIALGSSRNSQKTEAAFFSTDVPGDADCNGSVEGDDAVYLLRYLGGVDGVAGPCVGVANLLCDDPLNVEDLRALLRYLGGLDVDQPQRCFPPGVAVESNVISQGTVTIPGTYFFDFENGGFSLDGSDIWWMDLGVAPPDHDMVLTGRMALIDSPQYEELNLVALNATPYDRDEIEGPPGAKNELPAGTVFADYTAQGNYAKAKVLVSDYDLQIEWVLYGPD